MLKRFSIFIMKIINLYLVKHSSLVVLQAGIEDRIFFPGVHQSSTNLSHVM